MINTNTMSTTVDYIIFCRILVYGINYVFTKGNIWGPVTIEELILFIENCLSRGIYEMSDIYFEYITSSSNFKVSNYVIRGKVAETPDSLRAALKEIQRAFETFNVINLCKVIVNSPIKQAV